MARWNCHGCDLKTDNEKEINQHMADEYKKERDAKRVGKKYVSAHWASSSGKK